MKLSQNWGTAQGNRNDEANPSDVCLDHFLISSVVVGMSNAQWVECPGKSHDGGQL
jgi:hypothetical protein